MHLTPHKAQIKIVKQNKYQVLETLQMPHKICTTESSKLFDRELCKQTTNKKNISSHIHCTQYQREVDWKAAAINGLEGQKIRWYVRCK